MQFLSESFCALPANWARWKSAANRRISSQSDILQRSVSIDLKEWKNSMKLAEFFIVPDNLNLIN
jgi:hypothetical protein